MRKEISLIPKKGILSCKVFNLTSLIKSSQKHPKFKISVLRVKISKD